MLRLIKIRIPVGRRDELEGVCEEVEVIEVRLESATDAEVTAEILVGVDHSEAVVRLLEETFGDAERFRLVLLPVEATVPRPEQDGSDEDSDGGDASEDGGESASPVSLEELRGDVTSGMSFSKTYAAMIVLSTLVATVGLIRDDVTVVIAAMIIAPLLKPNMALSLATTLADLDLAKRALKVNGAGLVIAVAVSMLAGVVFPIDPTVDQIALRTRAGILEILLAASAGAAGALSFTAGEAGAVVGVMVAVALLPPVVVFGLLLGAGHTMPAMGAGYLTVANIVCLNLAGVVTFFVQRIRPRTAWESERAGRAIRLAVLVWLALLSVLIAVIVFSGSFRRYP